MAVGVGLHRQTWPALPVQAAGGSATSSGPKLATGQAAVAVRFPYASDGFFATSDRTAPDEHTTLLQSHGEIAAAAELHTFELKTSGTALELVAAFVPQGHRHPGPRRVPDDRGRRQRLVARVLDRGRRRRAGR
ncbi:hypothetical protein ABZ907_44895 [Nonomuraea wenchangensis]